MNPQTVLGVVLLAALPGSLLVSCTTDEVPAEASATPVSDQLVGTWITESPGDPGADEDVFHFLKFGAGGLVTYSSGLTPGSAEELRDEEHDSYWTYLADKDSLRLYGGEYCGYPGVLYPFTLADDQLTFGHPREGGDAWDDSDYCLGGLSGTAWSRETTWAPRTSAPQLWASVFAAQEAAIRPSLVALDEAFDVEGVWAALQNAFDDPYGEVANGSSVEEIQSAASVVHETASAMHDALAAAITELGQPPDEVSALVDAALVASQEAEEAALTVGTPDICDNWDCRDAPSSLKEATEQLLRNFDAWASFE